MPSFYKENANREFSAGQDLPIISTSIDSVRAYQFEVRFTGLPDPSLGDSLTLAAKQVSPINVTVEDIVVDRVNDKMYYPGKYTPESVTVTFDNLYVQQSSPQMWNWFKTIYDPMTGDMTQNSAPGGAGGTLGAFKAMKMTIVELDNTSQPHANIELYGVYPTGVRFSEKNYSTNEFSTLEATFRYDFVDYFKTASVN
tara:strand:- start:504 stop:1097 length:594 start_codon:yes stop_codon:yes gene_type:complete